MINMDFSKLNFQWQNKINNIFFYSSKHFEGVTFKTEMPDQKIKRSKSFCHLIFYDQRSQALIQSNIFQ